MARIKKPAPKAPRAKAPRVKTPRAKTPVAKTPVAKTPRAKAPRARSARPKPAGDSVSDLLGRLTEAFPKEEPMPQTAEQTVSQSRSEDRALIATARFYALRVFLARTGHDNVAEASDELGLTDQQVWDMALHEAGLPPAPMPTHFDPPS